MNLEHILVVVLMGVGLIQTLNNHKLEEENEQLKIKYVYNKASSEANATKHTEFNRLTENIEREYNATITDVDDTPVGGSINFGVRE